MRAETCTVNGAAGVITLRAGSLRADVAPAFGGRLLRFSSDDRHPRHWLVPITPEAAARGEHVRGGCFPLVPFSNRVRDARLSWQGHELDITPDPLGAPHAMHGQGWRRPWDVLQQGPDRLQMRLVHGANREWPFDYEALQGVRLRADGLELTLQLRCTGSVAMPAGIGWHPYFPLRSGMRLTARATRDWPLGADLMPTQAAPLASDLRDRWNGLRSASPRETSAQAVSGWDGVARLTWEREHCALTLDASRSLRHAILFAPADAPMFCFEPVSHTIDAFNLAARGVRGTGTRTLLPGQSLRGRLRLCPASP